MHPASPPAIAVIGLPELSAALTSARFALLTDATADLPEVNSAIRQAAADGRRIAVIAAYPRGATLALVTVLAVRHKAVLIVRDPSLDAGEPTIRGTREITLPATVDQIMAVFGAPPAGASVGQALLAPVKPASSAPLVKQDEPCWPDFDGFDEDLPETSQDAAAVRPPLPVPGLAAAESQRHEDPWGWDL